MICIFSEESAYSHLGKTFVRHILKSHASAEVLHISVIGGTHSYSELVRLVDLVLIQEVTEQGVLVCDILCRTEIRIHVLVGVIADQRNALRTFFIQRNTDLEITVCRTVHDIGSPRIKMVCGLNYVEICILVIEVTVSVDVLDHLSSEAAVLKGTYAETDLHAVVGLVEPAVSKVELKHHRIIEEAVSVHVMRLDVSRHMSEDDCAPLVAHLKR